MESLIQLGLIGFGISGEINRDRYDRLGIGGEVDRVRFDRFEINGEINRGRRDGEIVSA